MKKIIYAASSIFLLLLSVNFSQAATGDITQTAKGAEVTIDTTNMTQAPDLKFKPSTNVNIFGRSSATAFAVAGYHDQVNGKASGQEYGMASDTNKMFAKDISATAATNTLSDTQSAKAFTGWYTM